MELLKRFFSKLRAILTWQLVRSVGELQILTRASYVMLAVVPLLVGAWPSVRVLINSHNRVLERSTEQLAGAGDKLSEHARTLAGAAERATAPVAGVDAADAANRAMQAFAEHVDALSREVGEELASLRRQATLSPWLPGSWALAWFAALAVALGHVVYQVQAPPMVRSGTRDEHVKLRRDAFLEHQNDEDFRKALRRVSDKWWHDPLRRERIENEFGDEERDMQATLSGLIGAAAAYLIILRLKIIELVPSYCLRVARATQGNSADSTEGSLPLVPEIRRERLLFNRLIGYDKLVIQKEVEATVARQLERVPGSEEEREADARKVVQALLGVDKIDDVRASELAAKVDVIGEAALIDYDAMLVSGRAWMTLALLLYGSAAVIVLVLIARQSVAVLQAAGWI